MQDRRTAACQMVLKAAIRATRPGGIIYEYFDREGAWEADTRQDFAELKAGPSFRAADVADRSEALLTKLNGYYRTRHKTSHLPEVNRCLLEAIQAFLSKGQGSPLPLLESPIASPDEVNSVL